jgi:hypothetical protein
VTLYTHSPPVSRLRVAPYSGSVLTSVCVSHILTFDRASAYRPRISSKGRIQTAARGMPRAAWPVSLRDSHWQKGISAAVSAMFVSACRPNCPSVHTDPQVLEVERGKAMDISIIRRNTILINAKEPFLLQVPERWRTSMRRTGFGRNEIRRGRNLKAWFSKRCQGPRR